MQNRSSLSHSSTSQQEPTLSVGPAKPVHGLALASLCIGFAMIILDANLLNVALPAITHALHAGPDSFLWFVNIYALIFATLLLSSGTLGDRLGAKPIFLAGLMIFTAGSLAGSFAPNITVLIVTRGLQGVGAALLAPGSLSLITHTYPDVHMRTRAVAIYSAISGIGFVGGPLLGGLLVDTLGWRSIFLLNVPIGILAIVLTIVFVTAPSRSVERGFDLPGQLLAIFTLAPLTYALVKSEQLGWTALPVLLGGGLSLISVVLFLLVEHRSQKAMFPLRLFTSPTFTIANVIAYFYNFGLYSLLLVLTLFLQNIQKISALMTGVLFLPLSLAYLLTSWLLAGRLTARYGVRIPLLIGTAAACLGTGVIALNSIINSPIILSAGLIVFGCGIGLIMPSMTAAVLSSVQREQAGIGSAILNTSRQVGGVLGPALAGTLVSAYPFKVGMQSVFLIIAAGFFLSLLLAFLFIPRSGHKSNSNWSQKPR